MAQPVLAQAACAETSAVARDEPRPRGLRLLSLDGGGVRGVSELYILKKLVERLKAEENLNMGTQQVLPCNIFDIICGTSTGGLIAIMLGRLRMSIEDCEKAYGEFAEFVFNDPKLGSFKGFGVQEGRFKATKLKQAIIDIVSRHDKENDRMFDHRQGGCKVFVCAKPESADRPRRFRTYEAGEDCKIWEAARASTAAPTYFKVAEVTVLPGVVERFVDGGLGCNNPVLQLCDEASRVYPGRKIDCIISIGTGTTPSKDLIRRSPFHGRVPLHVISTLKDLANECETSHEIMFRDFKDRPNTYFRFTVPGVGVINMADWKSIPTIRSKTLAYLDSPEIDTNISTAAKTLRFSTSPPPTDVPVVQPSQNLSQIPLPYIGLGSLDRRHDAFEIRQRQAPFGAGQAEHMLPSAEEFNAWHQEFSPRTNVGEGHSSGMVIKDVLERQQAFLQGLKVNLESVRNTKEKKVNRFNGTCEWFQDRDAFNDWKARPGDQILVVVAPPGSGKSVLAKYLVEEFTGSKGSANQTITLDYFCHGAPGQSTALAVVQYFLYELLHAQRYLFKYVFQRYTILSDRGLDLKFEVLWKIFVAIMRNRNGGEAYCIIDGIDECDSDSQKLLLDAIEKDFNLQSGEEPQAAPYVRFLLTSRPTALATKLGRLSNLYEIQKSDVNPDISNVIEFQIQRMTRARILPEHLESMVSSLLSVRAEGMFLWVTLNLERLNQVQRVRSVVSMLEELSAVPKNVEAIYAAAIEQIKTDRAKQDLAEKIFGILLTSYSSLDVKAFAIACCDWPDSCTLHSELDLYVDFNFEYSSKEACNSLIHFLDGTIQFCHPTAWQYLLADGSPLPCDPEVCHLDAARTCLRYLLLHDVEISQPDGGGRVEMREDQFPFLDYALRNWARHLKDSKDFITIYPELLRKFLHCENGRFKKILHTSEYFQIAFPEGQADSDAHIVHALAFFGLWHILQNVHFVMSGPESRSLDDTSSSQFLELQTDVDARDSNEATPLMVAASQGSIETIQALLSLNANPRSLNKDNQTALHIVSMGTGKNYVDATEILIPLSGSLEARDSQGDTPLLLARSKELAEMLLKNGADVNGRRAVGGSTSLALAALAGNEDLVELLLNYGADINLKDDYGWTALHSAANQPNAKVVTIFLHHKTEVQSEELGINPLHLAAAAGYSETIKLLLDYGVNIDCTELSGQTALNIAAFEGHENVVDLLLLAGADIMKADENGSTPLHAASFKGRVAVAERLIQAGAGVNQVSKVDETPLTWACGENHLAVVKLLLDSGADKDYTTESQIPMLQLAIYRGYLEVSEYLIEKDINLESTFISKYTPFYVASWQDHVGICNLLLDKHVNPQGCGENGQTALHCFARNGREELLSRLLEMDLDPNVEDAEKWTPLHVAMEKGHLSIAKILLKRGASINAKTSHGATPLFIASENGHLEIVEWLLAEKADPNEYLNTGWSPLHSAVLAERLDLVNRLLQAGASPNAQSETVGRPLCEAARLGNINIVKRLLEADPVERAHSSERWTPLSRAVTNRHLQVVDELLNAGADPNYTSPNSSLPFHLALRSGDIEITKRLFSCISDPLRPSPNGDLSLHSAAWGGNVEIVDIVLNLNADVNQRLFSCTSALHLATFNGHVAVIDQLLQYGADVDSEDSLGNTPLMLGSLRNNIKAVERLLKAGADPNKLSIHHTTSLHWAAWNYMDSSIKVLLEYKADPLITDCYGRSSFEWVQSYEPASELMAAWRASYRASEEAERRRILRFTLAVLSKNAIDLGPENIYGPINALGRALFFFGEQNDAFVGFEHAVIPIPETLRGIVDAKTVQNDILCSGCASCPIVGIRFICKTCAEIDLCESCMEKYEGTPIRGCVGHEFLGVPRPSWFNLRPGTVNEEGETLDQWLQRIYDTYKDAIVEESRDASIPVSEPVVI